MKASEYNQQRKTLLEYIREFKITRSKRGHYDPRRYAVTINGDTYYANELEELTVKLERAF